ncbi:MAG TPA: YafY family protein [Thermoanaerobaculia bacterium]|jgi:predicted DNA-binding transcriptional regulator YafY
MHTTRVLAMLELLQTHGPMSGALLAERLGVDGRTVRRYVTVLEEMGIPLVAERGRHGAYGLVAGFKLPPMMFTDDEALALSVGLLAARGLGIASPAVASAQAKLERVMPPAVKRRIRAVDETVQLDLSRPVSAAGASALAALSTAAQSHVRVHMRYHDAERGFDPYGLAYRGGCWYAVGWCHLRRGIRSFRLDRIQSVRVLETPFARPADFDALQHLTVSVATIPRKHAVEVVLHTDLLTAQRELFATIGILEPMDKAVLLRGQCDDLKWFARELARLPFAFTVRSPRALRTALATVARELMRSAAAMPPLSFKAPRP